ncbi:MAG: SPOR domain-containing protein [Firmicutes bacterium]|nr:SPOR domain-containing protein [Bacillota bacterium]
MYRKRRTAAYRRRNGMSRHRNAGTSLKLVVIILCISVGCGYATAKYVVEPVVNYIPQKEETQTLEKKDDSIGNGDAGKSEQDGLIEDEAEIKDTEAVAGYAVQFGCYSSRAAAEAVKANIDIQGLQIIEYNKMYKITGEIYSDKEKAKKSLAELPENIDAFVTAVYK